MTENLDNLLPVHHFLDKPFGLAHCALLTQEVFARAAADRFCNEEYRNNARKHYKRKPKTVPQHYKEQREHHYSRRQKIGQRLGHHLPQSVDIVGVIAHNIAVTVGVEILYRQILHAVKHLPAQFFKKALRNNSHKLLVDRARNKRKHIQTYKQQHVAHYLVAAILPTLAEL